MKMVSCICKTCNKIYEVEPYRKNTTSYCSRKCQSKKTSTWILKTSFVINRATEEEKLERLKKNFEKYVIRKDECWDWKGKSEKGYPKMTCRKYLGANLGHRASWIIHIGQIPKDMCICHKCDNRLCTNPEHLFLGTQEDNVNDMLKKHRNNKGEKIGTAKLTENEVKEIKYLLKDGVIGEELAKKFKVSPTLIGYIKNGKYWKHVTIPEDELTQK